MPKISQDKKASNTYMQINSQKQMILLNNLKDEHSLSSIFYLCNMPLKVKWIK